MSLVNRTSFLFKIISIAIVGSILAAIAKVFLDNWEKIPFEQLTLNTPYLPAAVAISVVNAAGGALLWRYVLRLFGEDAPCFLLWRVNTYSQLVRYLPGKIWQPLGKMYWGKKLGISEKTILLTILIETVLLLGGAFLISLYSLRLYVPQAPVFLLAGLAIAPLVAFHPALLERFINTMGRRWLKERIALGFSYGHSMTLVLFSCLLWIGAGLQCFLLIRCFYIIPLSQFWDLTSLNAGSWLVGFVSVIAPSGLGVKEGVFVIGFRQFVPVPFAIACAVLFRLFAVTIELTLTALFFVFDKGAWANFIELGRSTPNDTGAEE